MGVPYDPELFDSLDVVGAFDTDGLQDFLCASYRALQGKMREAMCSVVHEDGAEGVIGDEEQNIP